MNLITKQSRQGDVLLNRIDDLPEGCIEEVGDKHRTVLAHGEVTGHAHAVYHEVSIGNIMQALTKIWKAPNGNRYLEVKESALLKHEEHTQHKLAAGFYQLPQQMQFQPAGLKRVAD